MIDASSVESLSGGAGWVGAGLLGVVLGWLLLRHLPDVLNDHRGERSARDSTIKQLIDAHSDATAKIAEGFRAELRQEREICERRDREFVAMIERNQTTIETSLTGINRAIELNNQMVEQWMRFTEGHAIAKSKQN